MNNDYIYLNKFIWNKKKAQDNIGKHGVEFELACRVFNDPALYYLYDSENSSPMEDRYVYIGNIGDEVTVLSVAATEREPYIRIISARKATKNERKKYEESAKNLRNY